MSQAISQPPPIASAATPIIQARGIQKTYRMGDSTLQVLKGVDLSVRSGEFLAIEGRSGSGKSTLLHLLGALDSVDAGAITYNGEDIARIPAAERSRLRNQQFGFVFQFYHLLPELNVIENTLLGPMIEFSWWSWRTKRKAHYE